MKKTKYYYQGRMRGYMGEKFYSRCEEQPPTPPQKEAGQKEPAKAGFFTPGKK